VSARRRVVVAGATGLVGAEIVRLLAARADVEPVALVRRPSAVPVRGVVERVFDFDDDAHYAALATDGLDALLCALGTTRRKAGSDEAFLRVDRDLPLRLFDAAERSGRRPVLGLVSSVGADSNRGLYLRAKHAVERRLLDGALPYAIVRPSLLLGDRAESRPVERASAAIGVPLFSALVAGFPSLRLYAPIRAEVVARALVSAALDRDMPRVVLEGEPLFAAGGDAASRSI
jgi:uncharacterized protein YbjT (DUF2867 family)